MARVPTGRLKRLARLAKTSATTGVALLRQADDVATKVERTTEVLSNMRGMATKVGQMASYVDGVVPDQHRMVFEKSMQKLQSKAQTSTPSDIRRVVEEDLGGSIDELFLEWDDEPLASASIGQVHRARLPDEREVAVKVQHPGIGEALEADLDNGVVVKMAIDMFGMRRLEADRFHAEIKQRFLEELDYTLEARRQAEFAALHASEPTIHIPAVHQSHTSERVITSELVSGKPFTVAMHAKEPQRALWAETLWRFVYGSMVLGGVFNADPHPGNYLFQPDGRITFLDFGCVQDIPLERRRTVVKLHRACAAHDWETARDAGRAMLHTQGGPYEERALAYLMEILRPVSESPFRFTPDYVKGVVRNFKDNFKDFGKGESDDGFVPLPEGMIFLNRLQFGFYSILARLNAEVDYRRVEAEWLSRWEEIEAAQA
ncbi:MAG: AarF/ABC1/UbiB kinase family protein [Alphaproteobacteria bacterium]|nr:AarF/ABC1/UbiB kinase family protein [Alphaproteobacteria bacterium]